MRTLGDWIMYAARCMRGLRRADSRVKSEKKESIMVDAVGAALYVGHCGHSGFGGWSNGIIVRV